MTKHIKETVNPPRGPDEYNFWKYHLDNTEKWDHPQGNESVFKSDLKRQPRIADDLDYVDFEPEANITADWVDDLLTRVKNSMRGYIPGPDRADLDEGVASKVWNWWNDTSPKEIAKKVKKASLTELVNMTKGIDPKSARRMLSGPKLVEYNFAVKRLQKMEKEIREDFAPGVIDIKGEEVNLSEEDSKLLNRLYNSLNDENQKKLQEKVTKDVETFQSILKFAREKFSA